ncbi:transglutaminase domain-containing protein [Haloferula rosea]|uniref:Transglutaminase-like domain-containing protein n=1 Tax=Haloferula rosea TaxID=490093 RepID=A0A934R9L5_9BACT|nr:transglutaminase domain-containing protein [Haloferula rosea]MBK1825733.1 hypothetical protein [Haloferula rosea]
MKFFAFILLCLGLAKALPAPLLEFIEHSEAKHGDSGARAAKFLIAHMQEEDRKNLTADFLNENLDLAFEAKASFPWAKELPEAVFLNDVLPYAVFDEPRDPWRADFLEKATPIVQGATSASEAAQRLNKEFFKLIKTHYHTGRKRTNQSPKESIEQGKATCTGLSIILVDACRAVGIPARAVGTPLWTNGRGNHTWVEIYDKGEWHFTGADEYDAKGLNRGWFTGDAAKADADKPLHAIYATSWEHRGTHFPMVWAPRSQSVGGVNVTERYAQNPTGGDQIGVRLFANESRQSRIAAKGWLTLQDGSILKEFTTKAGTTDLNDMPRLPVKTSQSYRLRFEIDGSLLQSQLFDVPAGETTMDFQVKDLKPAEPEIEAIPSGPLSSEQAAAATRSIYQELVAKQMPERRKELDAKTITLDDHSLRWLEKTFGDAPSDGRSLWISMHGGGGAPARVNDQQWKNQIRLYQPKEGIYVAPRAPTDTWNLWHRDHIDPLFSRLIENMVALRGVNPDKVYLMGYSAGGDGVWQLAPRMADRFAAASMMAGHPNESKLDGLRNLPFGIFMGGADSAYKRNELAATKTAEIEKLHAADKDGYIHMSRIYKGMPHWMGLKDAESVPWMAKFTRRTWPKKIVWLQDDVTHDRFYWIELPDGTASKGQRMVATMDGQKISLKGDVPAGTRLLLHDSLLDLDKEIEVTVNDREPRSFQVERTADTIRHALTRRLDPHGAPTGVVTLD